MKFLHYAALIATTAAVRLQSTQNAITNLISLDKRIPSPEDVWNHFDTDNSGSWDLQEAQAAFKGAMDYFGHPLPKGWKAMVAKEFKKADTDGSGAVSPKEMGVYLFELVDENDDGTWSRKEVHGAIKALADFSGNKLIADWQKHVDAAFDAVDTNGDGQASPKELMAALEKHGVPDINDLFVQKGGKLKLNQLVYLTKDIPDPEEVWKQFDVDGSNSWDLGEAKAAFKAGMKYFGHPLPAGWEKAVEAEFKKADRDGSGDVDPKEMGVYLFELIDSNDDGAWDLKEVENAIECLAKFTKNKLKKGWAKHVAAAFNAVDKNGDGKATPKEILAALKKHGVPDVNALFE